jgi:hypothetical protein
MYVRIINLGTNWWTMHGGDVNDPFCFRRRAAYFNAAALLCGRRLHHSAIFPGQIRFNATSGFDPEFSQRALGKTFLCKGPSQVGGKCHLLFVGSAIGVRPDACLVTLRSSDHGAIAFDQVGWKSGNVQPISISQRASRYEAMLLLTSGDWVRSDLGRWQLNPSSDRLVLSETSEEVSL